MTPTPEAIIGLELDGKGFDEANRKLDAHAQGWERVAGHAGRAFDFMDRMGSRVAGVAGAAGIGLLINDLTRLEDVASRAALAVNVATGRSGWQPYQKQLRGAAIATSQDSRELGATITDLQMRVGGSYLRSPSAMGGLATDIGHYSRAYGIGVPDLGGYLESFGMFGGYGTGQMGGLLDRTAAQARAGGREGQTAQWTQAMAAITAQLGSLHGLPATNTTGLGAMYGAAGAGNKMFYDPGMFAAGALGVDQTLTHAYANPRMQAALQMAGVGYKWQREGLGGKHGQQMAKRVIDWSERQYGKGSIEQDLFLRSNFGDVSASMLEALGNGEKTWDQLQHPNASGQHERTRRRSKSDQQTLSANAQKQRERAGSASDGIIQGIIDKVFGGSVSLEEAAATIVGAKGAKWLAGKGFKALAKRGGAKAAAAAAAEATDNVAQRALRAAGASEAEIAAAGRSVARKGVLRVGAEVAGKLAGRVAVPAAVAEALINADGAGEVHGIQVVHQRMLAGNMRHLQRKFGDDFASDPRARAYAIKHFKLHDPKQSSDWMRGAMGKLFAPARAAAGIDDTDKFSRAVDRFEKAIRDVLGGQSGRAKTASYTGGADSAGLQSANDGVGASMVLASMLTGGGSSGGGGGGGGSSAATSLAAYHPGGGGGAGGAGWKPCTMTWYDPALGGTNSGDGSADPHHAMANGQPYQAGSMTCAAPKAYSFGTRITFALGGKTVTCTVTDRGGAITGAHFDLSRGAAQAIGLIRAGHASGKFKVVGSGGSSQGKSKGSGGASGGSGGSGGNPEVQMASWAGSAPAAPAQAWGGSGGGSGGGTTVVNVDGREVSRTAKLTRGRA